MEAYLRYLETLSDEALAQERKERHYEWVNAENDAREEYALAQLEAAQTVEAKRRKNSATE